jgi:pyruvate formate-lyase/glycerol dehydratase family glycyl radical enzyme
MTTKEDRKKSAEIGSWQELFVPNYSERIKKAKERALQKGEVCLERSRAEMKAYEQYKDEPRIIQRARFLETYLRDKIIFILDDELIVGNINSKVRGITISGTVGRYPPDASFTSIDHWVGQTADNIEAWYKCTFSPEDKKEFEEVITPYFKGKRLIDHALEELDGEVKENAFLVTSSCLHIPNTAGVSMGRDVGHQMPNNEKVLNKGLKGIRKEVEWYMAQLDQPYTRFGLKEKSDFYKAVLITLEAAMAYSQRFSELAREMADKEANPKRKKELDRIAEVCAWVPANPARDWWEALQSVWMIHAIVNCELAGEVNSFGRFDQYMYPFYKKSVIDEKTMSRDKALELLECFQTKIDCGKELTQSLTIGGQTRDGKDACNEVTMLCLEADEQLSITQPETAMRIWEGTPERYLRKAAEVIRLGRGKPKFTCDRKGIEMVSKGYPDLTIEDWREYVLIGCSATDLPYITMAHNWEGDTCAAKLLELVLNNGKCALCGRQIGPLTGDPRTFESMAAVRQAFREQAFYWTRYFVKGVKVLKENQARYLPGPFSSSLSEGPLQKGRDITQGGSWYTTYGILLGGLADTADSLGVIDKLIYRDKEITWDQLLKALRANWKGYENLRQKCINFVPKYGNDNDFADDWAVWVMDTWQDSVDWVNTQRDLLPSWGGKWLGKTTVGQPNVQYGHLIGALPNGRLHPQPLADTISPSQGKDTNGPTAVIKSVSKLPTHRLALGGPMNLRLSPQLVATDRDIDNFVAFLRSIEELGIYHIQFNVIKSDTLRKAMKNPENYKDLMVRVASYVSYFVDLTEEQQLDIINRTEQQGW